MTHEEKITYLLKDLGQKGISEYSIAPLIYRLLWRLGIEIKPPHFASFWSLAVFMGLLFGLCWGIFMWFAIWSDQVPSIVAFTAAGFAGVFFGVSMATYYRWRAHKLMLPRWEEYPTS
jgi:Family of unknown function (DUF6404)